MNNGKRSRGLAKIDEPWECFGHNGKHGSEVASVRVPFDAANTSVWIGYYDRPNQKFGTHPSWNDLAKKCLHSETNEDDDYTFPGPRSSSHELHRMFFYCSGCLDESIDGENETLSLEERELMLGHPVSKQIRYSCLETPLM